MQNFNVLPPDLELFNEAFIKQGGIWYADINNPSNGIFAGNTLKAMDDVINFLNVKFHASKFPPIILNFIDNHTINACATKYKGHYLIGINIGTLEIINYMLLRAFAHPDVLSQFGNIKEETPPSKIFNAQIQTMDQLIAAFDLTEAVAPVGSERRQLAMILTGDVMHYIVCHELIHIINGHVDYRNSKLGNYYLDEDQHTILTEDQALFSQTLEMDADSIAMNIIFNLNRFSIRHPEIIVPGCEFIYQNEADRLFLSCFSINFYWRLFGMNKPTFQSIKYSTHPSAAMRQFMIASTIVSKLIVLKETDLEEIMLKKCTEAVNSVEYAFSVLSEQGYDNSTFRSVLQKSEREHIAKLCKNWANVRPLLEPFAFVKLPPVNYDWH